ncbi:MAG: C40 family peptidase [Actinomycetales bacterium]|nr:C40 family peptidase [Actinomycetales bacterium]
MAKKGNGRHRAPVELNLLEEFELRSRRSVREAERARQSRAARRLARKQAKIQKAESIRLAHLQAKEGKTSGRFIVRQKVGKSAGRNKILSGAAMFISIGVFGSFALPAYAYNPEIASLVGFTTTNPELLAKSGVYQQLVVSAVNTVKFARGSYSSTDAAEIQRQEILNGVRTYNGLTAEDYLANPIYTDINASKVLEVASKYVGTPYVFGGITPAGFDCSGYVAYVFSQFGVALPHSVHAQNRLGQLISEKNALPGDLVVFDDLSHDGIYAGNGNFYHAPRPGDTVKLAPIFTPNVHYVRIFKQK